MTNENLLVQLNVGDLQQLIKDAVKEEFNKVTQLINFNKKSPPSGSEVLTRKETSKLLQVSLTCLYNWDKSGFLKARKMNRRSYYLKEEVLGKLK